MSIRRHIDRPRRLTGVHIVVVSSLFTLLALAHGAPASDMIYTGGNLTDVYTLVSAGGSFTLGFFSLPGEPTKRYLGAWFSFSPSPDAMAIYWVANRDRPLADTSGVLVLSTTSGALLLLDGSNNTLWSSSSTSSSTAPPMGARLLESGNFVVVQAQNNRTFQWQLFDHPCNALLPGMKIGQNLWNGDEWYLSSWRSAADPGTGSFRYTTELGGGTPENVMWDRNGTEVYRTGPWNGERFGGVPEMASYASNFSYQVTVSPSEVTYSYTAKPGAPFSQLRLGDGDAGVVQRLVWDAGSRQWNPFLREPRDDCDDYAHCGPFGLCDRNAASTSLCSCFNGFVPAFPKEWILRDYSGGCRRNVSLDCGGGGGSSSNQRRSSTDGFQVVPLVKLPDTQNAAVDMDASLDECRLRCLANCSCVAYAAAEVITAGGGGCIIWTDSFTDLRFIEKGQDFYLRLPKSLIGGNKKKFSIIIVVVVVVAALVLAGIIFGIVWWRRRRVTSSGPAEVPSTPPPPPAMTTPPSAGHSIHYQILKDATNNFSEGNKIGQGSFGTVYKCELSPHESTRIGLPDRVNVVAVKVLNRSVLNNQSVLNNFEREVQVCLGLSDVNLARLLAYCNTNTNGTEGRDCKGPILIYEYMEKGSLDRYIFGEGDKRRQLSWTQRLKIVTSVAEGVWYLHVRSNRKIVHRDLKPANILLADDLTPKIADFGLAKHIPDHPASHTAVGPYVYSAPECRKGDTTMKSDVYSFGVVLLEIISGSQNCVKLMQRLLPNPKARNSWNTNDNNEAACTLQKLLDPEVPLSNEEEADHKFLSRLWRCIQIGLLCVQESPDKRPDIGQVLDMLKTEGELPVPPEESTLPTLREEGETSNIMRTDDDIEQNQ